MGKHSSGPYEVIVHSTRIGMKPKTTKYYGQSFIINRLEKTPLFKAGDESGY